MAVAERNPCHRPLLFACLDRSIERLFRMAYLAETIVSPRICLLHSVLPGSESLFLFLTFQNDACFHQFFLPDVPVFPYSPHRGSARGISLSLLSLISSSKDFTSQQKPSIPP